MGREGAGAGRRLLLPFPCRPGSACTPSPQVNWNRTGKLAASCHRHRSKGRGAAQRGMLEGGRGEEAGQGGPPAHCTLTGTTAMAGQSDPQRLGCPVPAASPRQSSLAEPSTEPVVMDHVDRR